MRPGTAALPALGGATATSEGRGMQGSGLGVLDPRGSASLRPCGRHPPSCAPWHERGTSARPALRGGREPMAGIGDRGAVVVTHGIRGRRFASPPAPGWQFFGRTGDGGCGRGRPRSRRWGGVMFVESRGRDGGRTVAKSVMDQNGSLAPRSSLPSCLGRRHRSGRLNVEIRQRGCMISTL
jgi:hypothetical protein